MKAMFISLLLMFKDEQAIDNESIWKNRLVINIPTPSEKEEELYI